MASADAASAGSPGAASPRPAAPARTVAEAVQIAADRFGDAEAVVDGSLRLSFRQLADRVRTAAGSYAELGVQRGDRVAIWAPNSAEWVIAAFGAVTAGAVLVPVNTRYKPREAHDIIERSRAKAVLVQPGFLGGDYPGPPGVPAIDLRGGFLDSGKPLVRETESEDVCDILFTSGTTGRPKGVPMTHGQNIRGFTGWCDLADLREGDRYLVVNPFFHMFGWKAGLIASVVRGATVLPVPVFDVPGVLDLVQRERVTMLPGPPTLYHELLAHTGEFDLSSLRSAVTGSADIPVELVRRMRDELPFRHIMTGYGMTEAGTVTTSRDGDSFESIATTVGTACDGYELDLAEDGEVLVRGFAVTRGYFEDPAATAEAIDSDGWFHTGDLGSLDDRRYLKIIGRKKDMFIVGGFNVYPAEVEGMLMEHPAVAQAAVVGVPDERMGQVGRAYVVLRSGAELSERELVAWARERMAGFKSPRTVAFRDALPLTASGKVMKDQLR